MLPCGSGGDVRCRPASILSPCWGDEWTTRVDGFTAASFIPGAYSLFGEVCSLPFLVPFFLVFPVSVVGVQASDFDRFGFLASRRVELERSRVFEKYLLGGIFHRFSAERGGGGGQGGGTPWSSRAASEGVFLPHTITSLALKKIGTISVVSCVGCGCHGGAGLTAVAASFRHTRCGVWPPSRCGAFGDPPPSRTRGTKRRFDARPRGAPPSRRCTGTGL